MALNIAITPMRIAQVVAGGAAVAGGFALASGVVRSAFREDMLGDPTRVVEIDANTMIYQTREPQGAKLTNYTLGAGAAAAFIGGGLLFGTAATATGAKALLAGGGAAALFALGVGAIAGATSAAAQFSGADFERVYQPGTK